jgi:polygalacturonase
MVILLRAGALAALAAAAPVFDVTQFGAVGDGVHEDTAAVRATFAAAAQAGPSTVVFPAGKTFLTGAFNLSSDLVVLIQGKVLAYPDSSDGRFVLAPDVPWFSFDLKWQGFIHSDGADNITMMGGGEVDGNGEPWWACGCAGNPPPPLPPTNTSPPCLAYERPKLVHLVRAKGVTIRDLTFKNSPMWHLRPSWVDDLVISNVTVLSPPNPYSCNVRRRTSRGS